MYVRTSLVSSRSMKKLYSDLLHVQQQTGTFESIGFAPSSGLNVCVRGTLSWEGREIRDALVNGEIYLW